MISWIEENPLARIVLYVCLAAVMLAAIFTGHCDKMAARYLTPDIVEKTQL